MKSKIIYLIIVFGVLLVFYLSWVPNPRIAQVIHLPEWLKEWVDAPRNDTIRTGVPFFVLGFMLGLFLKHKNTNFKAWLLSMAILTLIAVIAELGQLFLPLRNCDLLDVTWAFLGSVVGLFFAHLLWDIFNKKNKK